MAKALKCDRCGKYFDYDKKSIINEKMYTRLIHEECINDIGYNIKNTYDLCDKCVHDWLKFMNMEEARDVTE